MYVSVPCPCSSVSKNLRQGTTQPTKLPIAFLQVVGEGELKRLGKKKSHIHMGFLVPCPHAREGGAKENPTKLPYSTK